MCVLYLVALIFVACGRILQLLGDSFLYYICYGVAGLCIVADLIVRAVAAYYSNSNDIWSRSTWSRGFGRDEKQGPVNDKVVPRAVLWQESQPKQPFKDFAFVALPEHDYLLSDPGSAATYLLAAIRSGKDWCMRGRRTRHPEIVTNKERTILEDGGSFTLFKEKRKINISIKRKGGLGTPKVIVIILGFSDYTRVRACRLEFRMNGKTIGDPVDSECEIFTMEVGAFNVALESGANEMVISASPK